MRNASVKSDGNGAAVDGGEAIASGPGEAMTTQAKQRPAGSGSGGGGDAVYGIGMIGAWVYYFKRASTPQERIKAFLKGLVWPAFLVYELLVFVEKE